MDLLDLEALTSAYASRQILFLTYSSLFLFFPSLKGTGSKHYHFGLPSILFSSCPQLSSPPPAPTVRSAFLHYPASGIVYFPPLSLRNENSKSLAGSLSQCSHIKKKGQQVGHTCSQNGRNSTKDQQLYNHVLLLLLLVLFIYFFTMCACFYSFTFHLL